MNKLQNKWQRRYMFTEESQMQLAAQYIAKLEAIVGAARELDPLEPSTFTKLDKALVALDNESESQ